MSLLLDALHRASKDKEKAAVATALPVAPAISGELHLSAAAGADVSFPQLHPEPVMAPRQESIPELVLDAAPTLQLESMETVVPAAIPDVAPARDKTAVIAQVLPTVESPVEPEPPLTRPDRVAKEIRRAYAQGAAPSNNGKRRVFILGGVAVALLAGFASVFLGLWGDPVSLLTPGSASSIAPVAPIPALAESPRMSDAPAVAVSTAQAPTKVVPPVLAVKTAPSLKDISNRRIEASPAVVSVSAPLPQSTASSPHPASVPVAPAIAPVAPVHSLSGNEVVLRGASPKPGFVPKAMGPSPLELGYAALQEGRLDDAARSYRQALTVNPEERDAFLGLAYISHQKGMREDAQGYYRRVLRQEPGNAIANAALLGLDSEAGTHVSSSRARELAASQPDSAATMAMAGNALVRDGGLAEATQLFARAQILEPDNPVHAYNHAVALDRLGQYGAAKVQYENVLKFSDKVAPVSRPVFSLEAVRQRLEQLRQALGSRVDADK